MPFWSAESNQPRPDAPGADLLEEYEPVGDFFADYLAFVRLLGLFPHPALAPSASRESEEARAAAERELADTVRHQKRRRKKPVVKRAGAPAATSALDDSALATVRVENFVIDDGTVRAMALALHGCETLGALRLERVEISRAGLTQIFAAAAPLRRLNALVLDGTDVPASCADPSAAPPGPDMLKGHPFEPLTVQGVALQSLSLRCCRIDDVVARSLAEVLRRNSSIASLDLWGNRIGDDGATSIAMALRKNSTLISLSLSRNRIGDAGGEAMVSTLSSYVLPHDEVLARKKQRLDLEQKKADLQAARRKSKGGGAMPSKGENALMIGSTKTKRKDIEEQVEEQLRTLMPLEERDQVWVVAGNRTLAALFMDHNKLSEKVAADLKNVTEINTVITHVSC